MMNAMEFQAEAWDALEDETEFYAESNFRRNGDPVSYRAGQFGPEAQYCPLVQHVAKTRP